MTTVIRGTDDSASTPALTGTDADTGVFFPAANTMAMSTGGSERVRVDASGNVGIGTGSPVARLHVNRVGDGTFASTLAESRTKAGFILNPESNTSSFGLNISKAVDGAGIIYQPTNSAGTSASNNIFNPFGGNLLVGTTSAFGDGITLAPRASTGGTSQILFNRASTASAGGTLVFRNGGVSVGSITHTNTTTSYNTSSDYRLKENIASMTGALDTVAQLNPVTYNWKADGSAGEGFIAHELQAVCPQAVTGEKDKTETRQVEISPAVPAIYNEDGNELTPAIEAVYEEREVPVHQGVDTSFLVATLTAAIQELKAIVDAQAARIAALEAQ